MSDFVRKPILQRLNRGNYVSRVERLERMTKNRPSSTVGALIELGDVGGGIIVDGSNLAYITTDSNTLTPRIIAVQVVSGVARESPLPAAGFQPFAMPIGTPAISSGGAANVTLAANGGAIIAPVELYAPMLLGSVWFRNGDTSLERKCNWALYQQYTQTGDSSENILTRVAVGGGSGLFTPTAAGTLAIVATDAPVYLGPGVYWVVVQNEHSTNTLKVTGDTPSQFFIDHTSMTKTLTNPVGETLDFVAATWTMQLNLPWIALTGRVFGESIDWLTAH